MRLHTREADTQKAILDFLAARRIFAIRLNTVGVKIGSHHIKAHSAGPGTADILVFTHPVLWVEVKSSTGKQSPEQKSFQQKVESEGHYYRVARSVQDVIAALSQIQQNWKGGNHSQGIAGQKLNS